MSLGDVPICPHCGQYAYVTTAGPHRCAMTVYDAFSIKPVPGRSLLDAEAEILSLNMKIERLQAVAVAAVEALQRIKYAIGAGKTPQESIADCMDYMRTTAQETLKRIEESGWLP